MAETPSDRARDARTEQGDVEDSAAPAAGGGDGGPGNGGPADAEGGASPLWSRPWFPVLIACVVALVILSYILLPGVLLYPERPAAARSSDEVLAAQRATNQALEERIGVLRRVLEMAECRAPEGLIVPGGVPPMPGLPQGLPATVAPQSLLPTVPEQSVVRPPQAPGAQPGSQQPGSQQAVQQQQGSEQPGSEQEVAQDLAGASPAAVPLPELLDSATVLVLAIAGDSVGHGSGVVVGPGRVLTNQHVVEIVQGDPDARIFLTSRTLGLVVPARLVAATSAEERPLDLAMLESDGIGGLTSLVLSGSVERMGDVVAAGYPGAVVAFDEQFRKLAEGDASAAPELIVAPGMVTVIQNAETMPIVGHTAPISNGNSGGPLVDLCGRVIGINTFGPRDLQTISFAQSARLARDFLSRSGLQVAWSESRCEPATLAGTSPAPGQAAPQQPGQADGATGSVTAPGTAE